MSKKETEANQPVVKTEVNSSTKTSRRKVLKNTLVGGAVVSTGALPDKWSKPVLDSVILPAHAETTDGSGSGSGENTTAAPTTTAANTTSPPKKISGANVNYDDLDYDIV